MRISTKVVLELCDDGSFREIERQSYEYSGDVALAKKGRQAQSQNTGFEQGQAQNYANNASGYNSTVQNLLNEEIGSTTPGSMSPAASAMYSSDLNSINNTYNGMRQNLYATSGARGFGSAPSGFTQTSLNSINNAQGQAEQSAYNTGQENTEQQRQNAMQTAAGMYGTSTQGELGNTNSATNSAFDQSRMGSTLGDVLGGVSSVLGGISGVGNILSGLQTGSVAGGVPTSTNDQLSSVYASLAPQVAGLNTYNSGNPNSTAQVAGLNTFTPNSNVAGSRKNTSGTGGY